MNLYNQIFGINRFAPTLLAMLDVKPENIARFRDCYLDEDGLIVIYTRSGGMHRATYESASEFLKTREGENDEVPPGMVWNKELRFLPGYVDDMDDGYDATFAKFRYRAMSCFQPTLHHIGPLGATMNPGDRWAEVFAKMAKGECDTPEVKRATILSLERASQGQELRAMKL